MADTDHDHLIDTGKGEFMLTELGHLMPGMAARILRFTRDGGRRRSSLQSR